MGSVTSPASHFAFRQRPDCICGAPLLNTKGALHTIPHGWGDLHFRACAACGSWCQSPQITSDSLAAWYDSDQYQGSGERRGTAYENYEADEPQRLTEARDRFSRDIAPWLSRSPATILEIGCASGSLLAAARESGHRVVGVDLSPRFAEQARRLNGLELLVGDFLKLSLPERTYDAVLLFGTASNLPDLPEAFRKIRRIIREDGRVFLNFPHSNSWPARLYGRHSWMFAPSAATFASTRGLVRCAAVNGWMVEALSFDRQRPSFRKLLKHAKLTQLMPDALVKVVASRLMPVVLPIPAVKFVRLCPACNTG